MFKRLFGQRKYLSAITAGILVIQTFLPSSWSMPAFAEDGLIKTYTFDDAADYTTDTNIAIGQDLLYFKTTWDSTGYGTGFAAANDPIEELVPVSDGNIWAVLNGGDVYYSSDSGANWTLKAIPGITDTLDIAEVSYRNTPGVDLIAVGETISYSSDGGTTWSEATRPIVAPTTFVAVTASSANGPAYVVTSDNPAKTYFTSDGGASWFSTGRQPTVIASAVDIAWITNNIIVLVGNDGAGNGVLEYSRNPNLLSWGAKDLPDTEPSLTEVDYINGKIYVAGASGAVDGVYIAVSDSFDPALGWTNQSSDLADYDLVYISDLLGNSNIPFFVGAGADRKSAVFCSFDSGINWLEQSNTARDDLGVAQWSALAVQPTTNWLLMGGALGGKTDIFLGKYGLVSSSVATVTPIYNISKVTAIAATEHALSNGEPRFAFSIQSTDAGPWYYYNTGTSSWADDGSADDASKANTVAELTADVLDGLGTAVGNGAVYIKIYSLNANGEMLILDSIQITYNTLSIGGGGGGGSDLTRPFSRANDMDLYTKVDACNPLLTVTATARDDNSGVASVSLAISTNKMDYFDIGIDTEAPWEWNVPVVDGQTYYFRTMAADRAGNGEIKPAPYDLNMYFDIKTSQWKFGEPRYHYDASTTVDATSPHLLSSIPANDAINFPIGNKIVLNFSEGIDPASFTYHLFTGGESVSTKLTWKNGSDENGYKKAEIVPDNDGNLLEYSTRYFFQIETATDMAGNQIVDYQPACQINDDTYAPIFFSFTTQKGQNPDMRSSELLVADGLHNGKYRAGQQERPEYTLRLRNISKTSDANTVTATILFTKGISYVSHGDSGFDKIMEGGKVIGLVWSGSVPKNSTKEVKFIMEVDDKATSLEVTQGFVISDGINPDSDGAPGTFYIVSEPNFETSVKETDRTEAQPGSVVTYTITIKNTGHTVSDFQVSDFVPAKGNTTSLPAFNYITNSLSPKPTDRDWDERWSGLYYDNSTESISGVARDIPVDASALVFSFKVMIREAEIKTDIVNTASVWNPERGLGSNYLFIMRAPAIRVPAGPKNPLQVIYQSPNPDSQNNPLKSAIKVGFNYAVNTTQFDFSLANNLENIVTKNWRQSWEEDNTVFVLSPPLDDPDYNWFDGGELEPGTTYKITVNSATAVDKDVGPLVKPVSWQFTTSDPEITFTSPTDTWSELKTNTLSAPYVVTLWDKISDKPYVAEKDIKLRLAVNIGGLEWPSGEFWKNANRRITEGNPLIIPKKTSIATFYYRDSQPTPQGEVEGLPPYLTIIASDDQDPSGWFLDDMRHVTVVDENQPLDSLVISLKSRTITANKLSPPIKITAKDKDGRALLLPDGKLYFYSVNSTGTFYGPDMQKLPYMLTVQGVGGNKTPQFINIYGKTSLNVYYLDTKDGINIVTVADNMPQNPDIGLNDASTILNVQKDKLDDEDLLKELEEVKDDTGRVISKIAIKPVDVDTLPGKTQLFKAIAYDTKGKAIDNAKFKWFVLINESGKIKKDGDDKTTHQSTFTAGEKLGTYYDTVMVATLYNGKIAYATATVNVVDIVNYHGPKRLPVTGMNGLQLVLMVLTLAAAVALAWVEHYDKTHFKKEEGDA